MSHTIPAVYDSGVFRPLKPVDLVDGTPVEVQVPQAGEQRAATDTAQHAEHATALAWSDFIEQTYGSCAGLGLERPEQGDFEPREPIA